jgi:hypothetical protein
VGSVGAATSGLVLGWAIGPRSNVRAYEALSALVGALLSGAVALLVADLTATVVAAGTTLIAAAARGLVAHELRRITTTGET